MKKGISDRSRIIYLIIIMTVVALLVVIISIGILYQTALQQEGERLIETAQSQARILEAMARFDREYSSDYEGGAFEATLSQIREAHENYQGFGETGEFTLAMREGEYIVFLLSHRHGTLEDPAPILFDSDLAEPQRRALSGQSGTVIGLDYRGEIVLAAYEPVSVLDLGIVAKIDLSEIQAPYIQAGIRAGAISFLLVLIGSLMSIRLSDPVIQQLTEYSEGLEGLVLQRTQELVDTQEALVRQERMAMLGELAGSVGHELRNPLGVISNSIFFLKSILSDQDKIVKEYLDIVTSETHTAAKIISDLLSYGKLQTTIFGDVRISDIVLFVIEKFPPPTNIKIKNTISADLPLISADDKQIEQVFNNLLTNAYQAMPDGGEIRLYSEQNENTIQIIVEDTGFGISPENMKKIFEPLFTTRARGIGLGLGISKKIIEANKGSIEVESQLDKGTLFKVSLPTKAGPHG